MQSKIYDICQAYENEDYTCLEYANFVKEKQSDKTAFINFI